MTSSSDSSQIFPDIRTRHAQDSPFGRGRRRPVPLIVRRLSWLRPTRLLRSSKGTSSDRTRGGHVEQIGRQYFAVDALGRRIGRFASSIGARRALRTVRLRTRDRRTDA